MVSAIRRIENLEKMSSEKDDVLFLSPAPGGGYYVGPIPDGILITENELDEIADRFEHIFIFDTHEPESCDETDKEKD